MPTVMWRRLDVPGMERCVLEKVADGHRLSGTTLVLLDGDPFEIRYSVILDHAWNTRTVGARVQGPDTDRRLALSSDGAGTWSVADEPLLDLYGALYVNLAWTPATNTIVLKRLDLDVGEAAEVIAARIDFPGHDIARVLHRYERLRADLVRFETGTLTADLVVDADDIVLRVAGAWDTVARA